MEHAEAALRAEVGDADTIKVVVPVVRQGIIDGSPMTSVRSANAEQVAEHTASQLPGETIEAIAGEADIELAIQDALATFSADEIVVEVRNPKTRKGSSSRELPREHRCERERCPGAPRRDLRLLEGACRPLPVRD